MEYHPGYLTNHSFARYSGFMFEWVLINKVSELIGLTDDAVRAKIKRGHWIKDKHYRKAPDNRVYFHLPEIKKWIEGKG
jgi:hypothetical protein